MSMISAIIGSVGGFPPKTAAWGGITFDPINEGQQQTATVDFANWDSSTVYWELVEAGSGTRLDSRVVGGQAYGTISPGNGNSTQTINFTFSADATTEGTTYYVVRIGSTVGGNEYINQGNFTIRDTSQTPALVLDLDPANYSSGSPTVWPDTSGLNHTGGIYNYNTSGEAGGTFVWDGSTTQAEVPGLHNSTYGTITLSTWIKPTAVTGSNQTLIAKELCYKLRIDSDGRISLGTAKGYSPWEGTAYADAGLVTTSTWSNIVATVDDDFTRIYINGVEVTETSGNIIGANNNPFDIGMYQTTGSPSDFFSGLMGEVKVWNYALTGDDVISQYNSTAARYGLTPIPRSIYYQGSGDTFVELTGNTSDWNLGSTFTIEAWTKSINASTNTIRTIVSQGGLAGKIDFAFENGHLLFNNSSLPGIPEPTPGVWTHVAMVGDGSNVFIYYNGQVQGLISGAVSLTDGSSTLVVGRRGQGQYQYFYGDLANVQISNVAKYNGTFIPSTTATNNSNTLLLLDSFSPNGPLVDSSSRSHTVTNTLVTRSTSVPHSVTGTLSDGSGGTFGTVVYTFGDPFLLNGQLPQIPTGASITSNIPGFGIRTVLSSHITLTGWEITYDATGLSGTTSNSDQFNYYW